MEKVMVNSRLEGGGRRVTEVESGGRGLGKC